MPFLLFISFFGTKTMYFLSWCFMQVSTDFKDHEGIMHISGLWHGLCARIKCHFVFVNKCYLFFNQQFVLLQVHWSNVLVLHLSLANNVVTLLLSLDSISNNFQYYLCRLYKVALRLPCSDSSAGPVIYIMHWTIEPGCFWRTREHGWSII